MCRIVFVYAEKLAPKVYKVNVTFENPTGLRSLLNACIVADEKIVDMAINIDGHNEEF
jgi:hypothetical protein